MNRLGTIRGALPLLALFVLLGGCSGPRTRVSSSGSRPSRDSPSRPAETVDYEPRALKPTRLSKTMCERCEALAPQIQRVAQEHELEPALIMAIVRIESGFRAEARSRAGARGLMQVMPRTGRGLDCGNLYDAEENLRCGARVLQRNLKRYDGNMVYALAAYNGGPGYVKKAWEGRTLPRNFRYVEKVLRTRAYFLRHACCTPVE